MPTLFGHSEDFIVPFGFQPRAKKTANFNRRRRQEGTEGNRFPKMDWGGMKERQEKEAKNGHCKKQSLSNPLISRICSSFPFLSSAGLAEWLLKHQGLATSES
jgi:hypothetical protein